ncbi:MAG: hypothetical protein P8Y44_01185 [Acidobacteriota bacterium]
MVRLPSHRNMVGSVDWTSALVANLLILSVLVYAKALLLWDPDLFYRSLQEDEALEWATFWAFAIAAIVAFHAAARQRQNGVRVPWFLVGIGLFCFVVAMEEISWGQRLLGYRPPAYFLAENYQQELNFHNVISSDLRKIGLKAVILGYGVLLPLLSLVPWIAARLERAAVVVPPWSLLPSFAAAFLTYQIYPWRFSGELVELMLGLGFLFALLISSARATASLVGSRSERWRWTKPLKAWLVVIVMGLVTAVAVQALYREQPEKLQTAAVETEALMSDFLALAEIRCNTHKRIYTYRRQYDADELDGGAFASLIPQGLAAERASFFLDPWNSPYWVRHRCDDDGATTLLILYSFGPNRRRDSTRAEILGDDIGVLMDSQTGDSKSN